MADHKPKRRLRNYLLDPSLQLKFAFYAVAISLIVAGLVGTFLYRTTRELFHEMENAVQARSTAADASKELGNAALSAELLQHFEDPVFAKELESKSKSIDARYEAEKQAVVEQRQTLIRREHLFNVALVAALVAFAVLTGLGSIVLTHRVAGPIFRVRRMVGEVANGELKLPTYDLRDGDELRELFADVTAMIHALKARRDASAAALSRALELAERSNASPELRSELVKVQNDLLPPAPKAS